MIVIMQSECGIKKYVICLQKFTERSDFLIQALGVASGLSIDAEYLRIIQELRSLGLSPTGNKSTDAQRLAQAKAELVQRIHKKEETTNSQQELGVQVISQVDESEYVQRSEMEEQRLGAMTVAQLNKIYFGL